METNFDAERAEEPVVVQGSDTTKARIVAAAGYLQFHLPVQPWFILPARPAFLIAL